MPAKTRNYQRNPNVIDKEDAKYKTSKGHSVWRVYARVNLEVEEISGESGQNIHTHETFFFSRQDLDNMTEEEMWDEAPQLIDEYYEGQYENGVLYHHLEELKLRAIDKYDNMNIDDLPLQGESFQVRMLKNIKDVELQLEKNQCLFDYLCYKVIGQTGFEDYTRKQLFQEFGETTTLSINMIVEWIRKGTTKGSYDKNISISAWWENRHLSYSFRSNNPHEDTIYLNFMINDLHILPIENEKLFTAKKLCQLKTLTAKKEELEAEIAWDFDYHFSNYFYVDRKTFKENKQAILSGTFKPECEALIFNTERDKENPDDNIELVKLGNEIMYHTKHKLSYVNLGRGMFKHPTSERHQNYVFCEDFMRRKEVCDILFEKTKMINFKWNNQSWGEISLILTDRYMDNNSKWQSAFHPSLRKLVDELGCKPLVQGLPKNEDVDELEDEYKTTIVWDGNLCYTMSIIEGFKDKLIPIYHLGDNLEKFDIENRRHVFFSKKYKKIMLKDYLYYIPAVKLKPYGLIIKEGIYPNVLVQHLLDEKHITLKDIKYTIPAFQYVEGNEIVEFVEKIFDLLKDKPKLAKMIINVAVGLFNTKYESKKDEVMISTDPLFSIAYKNWNEEQKIKNLKLTFVGDEGIDWIRTQSKKRKVKDSGVINAYVVANGLVRTLKMLKEKWVDGAKLLGIKTDAIYLCTQTSEVFDKMAEKDPILKQHRNISEVHPKFYHELGDTYYDVIPEKYKKENVKNTLELYKKYPYKLEIDSKTPKFDEARWEQLEKSVGVVRDLSDHKLKNITEKMFLKRLKVLKKKIINETPDKWIDELRELCKILIYGTAGSGKTTLGLKIQKILLKAAKKLDKTVLITSYQRSTVSSWINKAVEKHISKEKVLYKNWDSFYGNVLENGIIKRKHKSVKSADDICVVMIDEFFQMPERCLLDMCELLEENPNIIFIPIGDYNQMASVESPKYNWLKAHVISNFVSTKIFKAYIPKSARFSKECLVLVRLLESGTRADIKKFQKLLSVKNPDGTYKYENNDLTKTKYHLCHFRKGKYPLGVVKINEKLCPVIKKGSTVICDKRYDCEEVDEKGEYVTHKVKCGGQTDDEINKVPVLVGEKYDVLEMRTKNGVDECKLQIDDYAEKKYGWCPIKRKNKSNITEVFLSPATASTVFREQGREITEPYTIHNADMMSRQALIVAISRGKSKKGLLFRFSNIEEVLKRYLFRCAYKNQNRFLRVPSCWSGYKPYDIDRPKTNEFVKHLLYKIRDKDKGLYVGEKEWNQKKTVKENLKDRKKGHLDPNAKKNTRVKEMNCPKIKPFYGTFKDKEPYYIYGKYKQILNVENSHIRWAMEVCKKKNRKFYNVAGTKVQPKIDEEKIKEYNVVDNEISRLMNKFILKKEKEPSKKDPNRMTNVIHNETVAQMFGKKHKLRNINYRKLEDMRDEAIGKLCLVSVDRVKKLKIKK